MNQSTEESAIVKSSASAVDAAIQYTRRGWCVVPIPHRSKNPGFIDWQHLRLSESNLSDHFNGAPQNIGILLGEPSGWLIDVDVDHPRALELADEFLPHTPSVFGRAGNPRSHRLYRMTQPVATERHNSKKSGMIVELRSTGLQTVFPPSTHPSGELITWENATAEPALIDAEDLQIAVQNLAEAVLEELGEKLPLRQKVDSSGIVAQHKQQSLPSQDEQVEKCLSAMLRMNMEDHNDGSGRLFAAACRCVEHGLCDADVLATTRSYELQKPFPRDWTDTEILKRFRDAEKVCERGAAVSGHSDVLVPLGTHDPQSGKLVISPKRTLPTAEAYIREFQSHREGRTLHCYGDQLIAWNHNRFVEIEDGAIKQILQSWLHQALRYVSNRQTKEMELVNFDSNPQTVKAALESIRSFAHLPVQITPPCWLNNKPNHPPAEELLPCRSMLLHLPTKRRLDPSPAFFTTNALEFDYDPLAPEPKAWLRFLHELFDDDIESQDALQEWFGYCLTADTSLQKMLLIVGPRRSGKGTIARILRKLIGEGNVCGPTTSGLARPFGLQSLIGKSLAIVSDARFSGDNVSSVVERLLCISGEDALTVDRKFLGSVTMKLSARFLFLSNELPRLRDSSGALAGRFVILRTTKSFFGQEDNDLTDKLMIELPGILNWAIDGWQRLRERGRFVIPQSVQDAVQDLEDLGSPVKAFVREQCVVGAEHRIWVDDLYAAWKRWCEADGRTKVSTKTGFGKDLASFLTGVTKCRGTGNIKFYRGIDLRKET